MVFLIEILLAGTVAVWLLGLLPALVVTARRGNSRLLGWGFLTFGLTWFAGALGRRSRRVLGLWLFVGVVSVVLLGAFIARPAPILGVDGTALENSMPRTLFDAHPCKEIAGGYTCAVETKEASGYSMTYRVKLHGRGCWTARGRDPAGADEPALGRPRRRRPRPGRQLPADRAGASRGMKNPLVSS